MNSNPGLIKIWNVSNSSINLTETLNSSLVTFRSSENDSKYFGLFFDSLHRFYLPYHGFLALAVCIFGIVSNILNITVLTRKHMLAATNVILTGLAVADILVMADYIPYTFYTYIQPVVSEDDRYSYKYSVLTLIHAHFSVVCHTISTWLTILLAVWRFLSLRYPLESKKWCSISNTRWTILLIYILAPIYFIPVYFSFKIIKHHEHNITYYRINWSPVALKHGQLLRKINMWVFSIGSKLIPCILLIYLSLTLIRVLMDAQIRKERLKHASLVSTKDKITLDTESILISEQINNSQSLRLSKDQNSFNFHDHNQSRDFTTPRTYVKPSDRTTRMLLAVLLIFLITEFPNGIVFLLSGILGEIFYQNVCLKVGEILDIFALINSAANFILYCTMSRLFRTTFTRMYCSRADFQNMEDEVSKLNAPKTFYNITPNCLDNHNTTCV